MSAPQQGSAGGEDYLDKAVDKAEQMTGTSSAHAVPQLQMMLTTRQGKKSGHAVDSQKYRAQNEKFTDKLRGWFEKTTGKKVCHLHFTCRT